MGILITTYLQWTSQYQRWDQSGAGKHRVDN